MIAVVRSDRAADWIATTVQRDRGVDPGPPRPLRAPRRRQLGPPLPRLARRDRPPARPAGADRDDPRPGPVDDHVRGGAPDHRRPGRRRDRGRGHRRVRARRGHHDHPDRARRRGRPGAALHRRPDRDRRARLRERRSRPASSCSASTSGSCRSRSPGSCSSSSGAASRCCRPRSSSAPTPSPTRHDRRVDRTRRQRRRHRRTIPAREGAAPTAGSALVPGWVRGNTNLFAMLVTAVAVGLGLFLIGWLAPVLAPMGLGLFLAALAAPLFTWLEQRGRSAALALALTIVVLVVVGGGLVAPGAGRPRDPGRRARDVLRPAPGALPGCGRDAGDRRRHGAAPGGAPARGPRSASSGPSPGSSLEVGQSLHLRGDRRRAAAARRPAAVAPRRRRPRQREPGLPRDPGIARAAVTYFGVRIRVNARHGRAGCSSCCSSSASTTRCSGPSGRSS